MSVAICLAMVLSKTVLPAGSAPAIPLTLVLLLGCGDSDSPQDAAVDLKIDLVQERYASDPRRYPGDPLPRETLTGCDGGLHLCNGTCVGDDDPSTGCGRCASCNMMNAACVDGACTGTGCTDRFDDLDGDSKNGCEALNPKGMLGASLWLWLRGGSGVSCEGGRAVSWQDESGHGRNAAPPAGKPGPLCGGTINGRPALSFGRDGADVEAGTLLVQEPILSKLSRYIVVERRDAADTSSHTYAFSITGEPICSLADMLQPFSLGWSAPNRVAARDECSFMIDAPLTALVGQSPPHIISFGSSKEYCRQLAVDGVELVKTAPPMQNPWNPPLVHTAIGRGAALSTDSRYVGSIAEVIVIGDWFEEPPQLTAYLKAKYSIP